MSTTPTKGRPRLDPHTRRDTRLSICVTEAERDRLHALAQQSGVSLTDLVRRALALTTAA